MDTNDILRATQSTQRLINDDNYYKYIFKKTERIVSVVFYILHNVQSNESSKSYIEDIENAARLLHDAVLSSLQTRAHIAEDLIHETAHALIVLESKLRVAQATGLIASEVGSILFNETDSVLRSINKYISEEQMIPLSDSLRETSTHSSTARVSRRASDPVRPQSHATAVAGEGDRRARILTVIEAGGEVTIKDISSVITDVSEKTIQRELNSMIEDNQLKRVGERRWSKYTLF